MKYILIAMQYVVSFVSKVTIMIFFTSNLLVLTLQLQTFVVTLTILRTFFELCCVVKEFEYGRIF